MAVALPSAFAQTDPASLTGIVVDDTKAELTGDWTDSTSTRPFLGEGYRHDGAEGKGEKSARFSVTVPADGKRHVLIAYTAAGNRAKRVPITITHAGGDAVVHQDQTKRPGLATGFTAVGEFEFKAANPAVIVIGTAETTQHVIVDGVRLLTAKELQEARKKEKQAPKPVAKKTEKKPPKPRPKPPVFARQEARREAKSLAENELQPLLDEAGVPGGELIDDVKFLRRVSLDVVGRNPTLEEYRAYLADSSPARRQATIDRLLASPDFGLNWGRYWSDVIGARQQ